MTTVHGLGVFLASADMVREPAKTAELAINCGSSWAAVLVESVDGRRQPITRVQRVVDALRARDVDPVLYTFPTPSKVSSAADHLLECATAAEVAKACLDLEPFRGEDWSSQSIRQMVSETVSLNPAITVFTRRRWRSIDWKEIAPNAEIWLQVYERAQDLGDLTDAIQRWPDHRVVPLFGTYVGDVPRLDNDLANVASFARSVGAAGLWALATTDAVEAAHVRAWALRAI